MTLATVANNQAELNARDRVMSAYPNTMRGRMLGLKQFSAEYVEAIKQGLDLERIGRNHTPTKEREEVLQRSA